jgi:hypothetical protein
LATISKTVLDRTRDLGSGDYIMTTLNERWEKADLFFLENTLRRRMLSVEQVAGFLGRSAGEVRAKAEQMTLEVTSHEGATDSAGMENPLVA